MILAGISAGRRDATVALADASGEVAVCAQERAIRVRGAGVNEESGLPDEALGLLLQRWHRTRDQIGRYLVARNGHTSIREHVDYLDDHLAHACTAYLTSPFSESTVVVCDHDPPEVSVWKAEGPTITPVDSWRGPGFATAVSRVATLMGFRGVGAEQRMEALARLAAASRDSGLEPFLQRDVDSLTIDPGLAHALAGRPAVSAESQTAARAAGALMARLGELLVDFLREVRDRLGPSPLSLGGSLFNHSAINTCVRNGGVYDEVFVPIDPGNGGLAVGAVLHGRGGGPSPVSPFLGPAYTAEETKAILDNCKLNYTWESEEAAVATAVRALSEGRLVGWFDGRMEWGARALGARSILANPCAPYVLENLNRFLKRREPWRGYALSGLEEAVAAHFEGPARAPFMECDFRPREPDRFREILPAPDAVLRIQTVDQDHPLPSFRRLLEAFGERTGLPFLVNTSFNGFHEPIVCSPRDAVRVFYGTGVDVLVMNQFVIRK